ncbi:hypothetical protein HDV05_001135 [Chytridiales sp. JEL 0842]|nr:hypothetical protein HDV05_001135 [Chytridiales sp. JEL 0842]
MDGAKNHKMYKFAKIAVCFIAFALLVTAVALVGIASINEGASKANSVTLTEGSTYPPASKQSAPTGTEEDVIINYNVVFIAGKVVNIDPIDGTFKMRFAFVPGGDFVGDFSEANKRGNAYPLAIPMNITIGQREFIFQRRQIMSSQEVTLSFESGDVNSYPFDTYTSITYPHTITGEFFNPTTNTSDFLPISFAIVGGLQAWTVTPTVLDFELDGLTIGFDVSFKRSVTTRFFSVFVMVLMWILAGLAFVVALSIWTRGRKVEPPTIAYSAALLFAMAAVRNTQPGVPPIGCTSDVVSFFWAMMLVAVSLCMHMVNYIIKYTS